MFFVELSNCLPNVITKVITGNGLTEYSFNVINRHHWRKKNDVGWETLRSHTQRNWQNRGRKFSSCNSQWDTHRNEQSHLANFLARSSLWHSTWSPSGCFVIRDVSLQITGSMDFILDSLHKIPILQLYWNLTGIETGPRWYGLTPIDWRWFRSKIWDNGEI